MKFAIGFKFEWTILDDRTMGKNLLSKVFFLPIACTAASELLRSSSTVLASVASPFTHFTRDNSAESGFGFAPRLETAVTSWPRLIKRSQTADPTYPVPPKTVTRIGRVARELTAVGAMARRTEKIFMTAMKWTQFVANQAKVDWTEKYLCWAVGKKRRRAFCAPHTRHI